MEDAFLDSIYLKNRNSFVSGTEITFIFILSPLETSMGIMAGRRDGSQKNEKGTNKIYSQRD